MSKTSYVICIDSGEYSASLEFRKIYQFLPDPKADKLGRIRVIDESGEDYLYPQSLFIKISLPKDAEEAINHAA